MQLGFVDAKLGFCDGKRRREAECSFYLLSLCVLGILGRRRKLMNKQQPLSLAFSLPKAEVVLKFLFLYLLFFFCNS